MVEITSLEKVGDETTEEIFKVLERLGDRADWQLGGTLYEQVVSIQKACLYALNKGTDNKEVVEKLQNLSGVRLDK